MILAVLGVLLVSGSASGETADQKRASVDPHWLGPSFAGLQVSEERHITGPEPRSPSSAEEG